MDKLLVSHDQAKTGIKSFISTVFTPKVPMSEYPMYFGKIAVMNLMLSRNWNTIADSDGMVDISIFYEQYSEMFQHTNSVSAYGFTFNKDDLNELMNHIRQQVRSSIQTVAVPSNIRESIQV